MFIFASDNGILTNFDDKSFITQGYSGNGDGLLNPSLQFRHNVGPIPRGKYQIKYIDFTPLEDNKEAQLTPAQLEFLRGERKLGPIVFKLIPYPDNFMGPDFPRSGFYIHWDTNIHNMKASDGCIVLYWEWVFEYIRVAVSKGDNVLQVI